MENKKGNSVATVLLTNCLYPLDVPNRLNINQLTEKRSSDHYIMEYLAFQPVKHGMVLRTL